MMKKIALAASLALVAFGASAMTTVADEDLSGVSGQDGVSIVADLNVNIGSFQWGNKSQGSSVNFNSIAVTGMVAMTLDVINGASFIGAAPTATAPGTGLTGAAVAAAGAAAGSVDFKSLAANVLSATGYAATATGGPDVIQIAFPTTHDANTQAVAMSITVDSIKTGNGGASMGSVAINNMDLSGTKVWIYGH